MKEVGRVDGLGVEADTDVDVGDVEVVVVGRETEDVDVGMVCGSVVGGGGGVRSDEGDEVEIEVGCEDNVVSMEVGGIVVDGEELLLLMDWDCVDSEWIDRVDEDIRLSAVAVVDLEELVWD